MRSVILLLLLCSAAPAQIVVTIENAARSAPGPVAPDSAVSAFASNLATETVFAPGLPLPTTLAGVTVEVTDSANNTANAPLIFVSPDQINFIIPSGLAPGLAKATVRRNSNFIAQGSMQLQAVAPGLFSASGDGQGPAAAIAIEVIDVVGPHKDFPTFTCDAPFQNCQAAPLNLGVDTPIFLSLFGTGIRGGKNVTVTVGGRSVPVLYAGSELVFPGLDQVNIPIPLTLRGAGLVDVVVTVDGQASNAVQILIR
jgi:uncharacterized protein (TIGR03437 family)